MCICPTGCNVVMKTGSFFWKSNNIDTIAAYVSINILSTILSRISWLIGIPSLGSVEGFNFSEIGHNVKVYYSHILRHWCHNFLNNAIQWTRISNYHFIIRNLTAYEIDYKRYSKVNTVFGLFPLDHTEFTSDDSLVTSSFFGLFLTLFSHDPLALCILVILLPHLPPLPSPFLLPVFLISALCLGSILLEES